MLKFDGNFNLSIEQCKKADIKFVEGKRYIVIDLEAKAIYLKDMAKSCAFCSATFDLIYFKNKCICQHCLDMIRLAKNGEHFY